MTNVKIPSILKFFESLLLYSSLFILLLGVLIGFSKINNEWQHTTFLLMTFLLTIIFPIWGGILLKKLWLNNQLLKGTFFAILFVNMGYFIFLKINGNFDHQTIIKQHDILGGISIASFILGFIFSHMTRIEKGMIFGTIIGAGAGFFLGIINQLYLAFNIPNDWQFIFLGASFGFVLFTGIAHHTEQSNNKKTAKKNTIRKEPYIKNDILLR